MARNVLVVDDSATLRSIVAAALREQGWTVWSASHGREALEVLAREGATPQLVISDWNMPVMDGHGLVSELRQRAEFAEVPILILTTETDDASKQAAREAGATGWLSKPVDPGLLRDVIESVLA